MGEKISNKGSEKHWLHMEEVQFEAAHLDRKQFVSWRHKYLVQMKRFQEGGKEIFYVDKSWIDSNITLVSAGKERQNLVFKKLQCQEQTNTSSCRK
jgi:hypothetical protein